MYEAWRYGLIPDIDTVFLVSDGFNWRVLDDIRPGGIIEYHDTMPIPQSIAAPYTFDQALEDFREAEGI